MLQAQKVIQLKMDEPLAYWKPKKLIRDIHRPTFMKQLLSDMTEHRKQKQTSRNSEKARKHINVTVFFRRASRSALYPAVFS